MYIIEERGGKGSSLQEERTGERWGTPVVPFPPIEGINLEPGRFQKPLAKFGWGSVRGRVRGTGGAFHLCDAKATRVQAMHAISYHLMPHPRTAAL